MIDGRGGCNAESSGDKKGDCNKMRKEKANFRIIEN